MSEQSVPKEDRVRPAPGEARLWFALLGSAAAWAVHFLAVYMLLEIACPAGWQTRALLGLNGAAAAVLLAGLAALPVVVASGLAARRAMREGPDDRGDGGAYPRHLGLAGVVLAGIFFLAIVAETVPALFLGPCPPGA
jgi:hypothetical protein